MKTKTNLIFLMVIGVMIIGALAFVPAKVMAQTNSDTGGEFGAVEAGTAAEDTETAYKQYAYLVKPCRIVDTRITGGYFYPGQYREYYIYGPYSGSAGIGQQGGYIGGCPTPTGYGEPYGVILNITAVPYAGYGNFKVYPANVSPPTASFVNYRYGVQNVANAGSVESYYNPGPREIEVYNENGYSHLVIDVMGYYYPN